MPPRRTRADLSEATCGGNRWEGALTFNESGTQRRITHKHANASNSFHLTARLCFKPAYCDRKGQSRARLRPTARLPLGRLISSLNRSSLCCHVVLCECVGYLKLALSSFHPGLDSDLTFGRDIVAPPWFQVNHFWLAHVQNGLIILASEIWIFFLRMYLLMTPPPPTSPPCNNSPILMKKCPTVRLAIILALTELKGLNLVLCLQCRLCRFTILFHLKSSITHYRLL